MTQHAIVSPEAWLDARREIQTVGKFDRLIRIGIQFELYERVLGGWLEWVRATMPKLAIYVEIDYSNQMILDLTTGSLDLAVLYSPQHLPDMHYEQIAEENFVMVSTRGLAFGEVSAADYIRANYSAYFNRAHKQMLPELEASPISTGNGGAVAYLLRSRGGTAFVTEAVATKLQQEGVARLVTDAPRISHPIYSAVHIRHHHSHTHVRLLKALKLMTA